MSTPRQRPSENLHEKATLRARVVELEWENDLLKQAQGAYTEAGGGLQTSGKEWTPELGPLQHIWRTAPIGLCCFDTRLRYVFVNEWLAEINGLSVEQHLGRSISEVLPDVAAGVEGQLRRVIETGEPVVGGTVEAETVAHPGVKKYFEHHYDAVKSADGTIVGVSCVVQDVTERKQAEEALRVKTDVAERANQAKSDFLANMSHEIRTPMTAILGFTENLLDPELSESDRLNAIHTVRRNSQDLLQIINDILDLSKIEADKMEIEQIECSPCAIVAQAASLMRARAAAGGLSLEVEYPGPIPETILTDHTRLRQILLNLLGNAIKFTKTGGVRLVVQFQENDPQSASDNRQSPFDNPRSPMIQFDVIDTGIGMTPQQAARLFQPFQQADSSTSRSFGGTGLGLTISRRFAHMLGGDVVLVETEPDGGSRFSLSVPTGSLDGVTMLQRPSEAESGTAGRRGSAPVDTEQEQLDCRILLAEDGPDNQRLISFILARAGADVTVAANGQEAVDKAMGTFLRRRGSDRDRPFDVILMDIQMPVMDGYTATRLLRRNGYSGTIVALTAHAMAGERQKCLDAGCDDFATKPIDRQALINMIREHTSVPAVVAG